MRRLSLALLVACTPAAAPAPSATTLVPAAGVSILPAPAAVAPTAATCILHATDWWADAPPLSLRPGGAPFAELYARCAAATLELEAAGARLQLECPDFVIAGYTQITSVPIYPRVPFEVAGFVVPRAETALDVRSVLDGAARVRLAVPEVRTAAPLEETRPCTDLGLEPGHFEGARVLSSPSQLRFGSLTVYDAHDVPLGTIDVPPTLQVPVRLEEQRATRSRVSFDLENATIHGWIESAAVVPKGNGHSYVSVTSSHDRFGGSSGIRQLDCATEIALYVERERVGAVRAHKPIRVLEENAEHASVQITGLFPQARVPLRVRLADVRACTSVATP